MLEHSPRFDLRAAERVAREHFGVEGRATALTSERDQNFAIEHPDGTRTVLKIANAHEDRAMLEAQHGALAHLAQRTAFTPRVLCAASGSSLVPVTGDDGVTHLAWAISWLPGHPFAVSGHRSPALFEDLGRTVGALDAALADFDTPAIHRDFYWDLANGRTIVSRFRDLIADDGLRSLVDRLIARFDEGTARLLPALPRAAVHGDFNDRNVLVGLGDDVETRDQRVTGIGDFGDMTHSYRIGDLAIAIAYAILGESDPLAVAGAMVRGFCERVRPTDSELAALFGLVVLRLCTSVCIAADQLRQRPDNEYLGVSQSAIANTLPLLAAIPFPLAEAVFREAAGVTISPAAKSVVAFLERERSTMPAVLGIDPQHAPSIVLDLSIESPLLSGDPRENAEPELTRRVFGAMRDAGVALAVGRYDEPRLIYVAPAFETAGGAAGEHRTIHIGLDLFVGVGTPVYAPLDGAVQRVVVCVNMCKSRAGS